MTKANLIRVLTSEVRKLYPTVTETMVAEVFEAWLAGERGILLPHSFVGMLAGRALDDVEKREPDLLTRLR